MFASGKGRQMDVIIHIPKGIESNSRRPLVKTSRRLPAKHSPSKGIGRAAKRPGRQASSAPSQLNVGVNGTGGIGETHGYKEVPMIKKYVVRLTDEGGAFVKQSSRNSKGRQRRFVALKSY